MSLIIKIATGKSVTDRDIKDELYDICDDVHSSCDSRCPVYYLNGYSVPRGGKYGCLCFKDGEKMLSFIREKTKETQQ